jgi:hypothetical protein
LAPTPTPTLAASVIAARWPSVVPSTVLRWAAREVAASTSAASAAAAAATATAAATAITAALWCGDIDLEDASTLQLLHRHQPA